MLTWPAEKMARSAGAAAGIPAARPSAVREYQWADPGKRRPGEVNSNDGGRGVYWEDPSGHFLEIITRPYGSGS